MSGRIVRPAARPGKASNRFPEGALDRSLLAWPLEAARPFELPTGRDWRGRRNNGRYINDQAQKSRPTHTVYVVEGEGADNSYWTKVGTAFAHSDQLGFNILLSALPINGRLVVRVAKANDNKEAAR